MIVLPVVRRRAEQVGPAGEKWLAGLDSLLATLAGRWSFEVGEQLFGGVGSVVFRVRLADRDAVLKLAIPEPDFPQRVAAFGGRGYARVYAYDLVHHALLLESLGPSLANLRYPAERVVTELGRMLRISWRDTEEPATPRADNHARFISRLWHELSPPYPDSLLAQALSCAENRAATTNRPVVVHGDPHADNALLGTDGFVFVDPDGFVCDPAYDCGVVLRDTTPEEFPALCRQLAEITELPEQDIAEWTFIERVSTGLYLLSLDSPELAAKFLDAALGSSP
jgi:streptomycin 6-kinase